MRKIISVSVLAALVVLILPEVARSQSLFSVSSNAIVRPGQIDRQNAELLSTRVKGTARIQAIEVEPDDIGLIMSLFGEMSDHFSASCGGFGASTGACHASTTIQGSGHILACSIPPTGLLEGDCDSYYQTRATGRVQLAFASFDFLEILDISNCSGLRCDCT